MQIFPEIVTDGVQMLYPHYQPYQYTINPTQVAVRWKNMGARWLHIESHATPDNLPQLKAMLQQWASMGLGLQINLGQIPLEETEQLLQLGVSRVFLPATSPLPAILNLLNQFSAEAIGVGFTTSASINDNMALGVQLYKRGLRYALCVDASREDSLEGVNLGHLNDFAIATQLDLISKGGVAHLNDLIKLKSTRQVVGTVVGRALYEGRIDLSKALALTR